MALNEFDSLAIDELGRFRQDITKANEHFFEEATFQECDLPETVKLSEGIFLFTRRRFGEHGNVYEGEVRSSVYGVRPCAIKFAELSEQNVREAEILTKLGSHTNVIAIIQSGIYSGSLDERVYIALDKCHNQNLRQYLANGKAAGDEFDLKQAIDFAKQMIAGVTYIHDNNIIHLDLKPSNILISQNLHVIKIADFGLSIVVKSPKSKILHKRQFGTNGYRPIESFGNDVVSQRSDIFSLGTVLLHLLSNGNDVFGRDEHTFIHNVMNDITDTSGLLVPNPKTTEHLIKCMVSKERCHRPNIWEVSDHPCWRGTESECNLEYFADDETDDNNDDADGDKIIQSKMTSLSDTKRGNEFLKKMREIGFDRKPTTIAFDNESRHLYRVISHKNKTVTKMHKYPDGVDVDSMFFSAVLFREYIYMILPNLSVYRLEYSDVTAAWTRMNDWVGHPCTYIPAVASSNGILLVISTFWPTPRKSVTMYDPSLDKWERGIEKPTATVNSSLLCYDDFLYCFGGDDETGAITNKVERMSLINMEWTELTSMHERRHTASVSEHDGIIYVLGGYFQSNRHSKSKSLNSFEMYNPKLHQWTRMKPMTKGRSNFDTFWIDGSLIAVGGDGVSYSNEEYNSTANEWTLISNFIDMRIYKSVLGSMST